MLSKTSPSSPRKGIQKGNSVAPTAQISWMEEGGNRLLAHWTHRSGVMPSASSDDLLEETRSITPKKFSLWGEMLNIWKKKRIRKRTPRELCERHKPFVDPTAKPEHSWCPQARGYLLFWRGHGWFRQQTFPFKRPSSFFSLIMIIFPNNRHYWGYVNSGKFLK